MVTLTLIDIQQMGETGSYNYTNPSLNVVSVQLLTDLKQIALSREKACVQSSRALSRYPHNLLKKKPEANISPSRYELTQS